MDICSHGRPDHQELLAQLVAALGLRPPPRPETPQQVFEECLEEIGRLRDPDNEGIPWL